MTSRKPTSDEQFGVTDDDDGYEGPTTELDELFGNHGYRIIQGPGDHVAELTTESLEPHQEDYMQEDDDG
jgi:hypothetical protein